MAARFIKSTKVCPCALEKAFSGSYPVPDQAISFEYTISALFIFLFELKHRQPA